MEYNKSKPRHIMKFKILLTVIIFSGFVSNIFPQTPFRSGIFLHHSSGGVIWGNSSPNVPQLINMYNIENNYTGNNEVTMNIDEGFFPSLQNGGNFYDAWHAVFVGESAYPEEDIELQQHIQNNSIVVIKSCWGGSDIGPMGNPADTLVIDDETSTTGRTYYRTQWHWRSIIRAMQSYPDNFFVIWTAIPLVPGGGFDGTLAHRFFTWAKDTLAAGNDPNFGDFPDNVFVFDAFHLLAVETDSITVPNWVAHWGMNPLYHDEGNNHPNLTGANVVAQPFIWETFDAAIAYESALRIKSNVNTKIFLQGPFSGGSMLTALNTNNFIPDHQPYNISPWNYNGSEFVTPDFFSTHPDMVDWVLLELRTGTESTTIVGRRAAFLKSDGSIVDIDGTSQVNFEYLIEGNYYLVIRHRNHLAVMSANLISLSSTSSQLYDFSIAQTQAYGTNAMKDLGGGNFGMYVADGNKDGGIYGEDYILYQTSQGEEGYRIEDYNLDGGVYGEDYILYQLNQGLETWVP